MVRRKIRRAFTLIELLLVLVILAVLAAVVIPKLTGRVEESKVKATVAELSNLKSALDTYEQDNGTYPTTNEGLAALVEKPSSGSDTGWHKLLDEVPNDKWGNPYTYQGPDTLGAGSFNVISAGADKTMGTEDDLDIHTKL